VQNCESHRLIGLRAGPSTVITTDYRISCWTRAHVSPWSGIVHRNLAAEPPSFAPTSRPDLRRLPAKLPKESGVDGSFAQRKPPRRSAADACVAETFPFNFNPVDSGGTPRCGQHVPMR